MPYIRYITEYEWINKLIVKIHDFVIKYIRKSIHLNIYKMEKDGGLI